MGKNAEIGSNPEYRKRLVHFGGKSQNKKVIEESESPEQANVFSPLETDEHNLKEIVEKGARKVGRIVVRGVAKGICALAEKTSELKDTLADWNCPPEDPGDPPAEGVAGIAQPNWETLILEEIESKSSYFSSLLNLTDTFIASGHFSQEDAEQLVQKWEYSFQIGECVGISHKLAELQHDQDAKAQLAGIMQLFHHLGLKKLDVQNPVAVSPENRFYFDNGTQFPDGTVCEIARWPWLYKEKVYYRGMLRQLENEQVL